MLIGYARVSTQEQRLDAQVDTLTSAGAENIFSDKISGTKRSRPELDRMLDQLREGDVVLVTKYDRLARSLPDLLDIVATVESKKAGFRSLAEDIDTTTSAGHLILHVFASIAQFERERIRERTMEGLKAARDKGRIDGRPLALSDDQKAEVLRLKADGRTVKDISALFNVSVSTVKRVQ